MTKCKKIILYSLLFAVGLTSFLLQLFVFMAPNGILGLCLCLLSIYLSIGSLIKLCRLCPFLEDTVFSLLDLLFFLP